MNSNGDPETIEEELELIAEAMRLGNRPLSSQAREKTIDAIGVGMVHDYHNGIMGVSVSFQGSLNSS